MDVFQSAQNAGCELGSEGVPDAVFGFGCEGDACVAVCGCCGAAGRGGGVDGDALFAVDGFAWSQVFGDEEVFFAACYEDTGVSVWFLLIESSVPVLLNQT